MALCEKGGEEGEGELRGDGVGKIGGGGIVVRDKE